MYITIKQISTLVFIFLLVGCTVQNRSTTISYSENKIDETTSQVIFEGNQQQSQEEVRQNLIYRCAKVTVKNGFSHFIVIADSSYKHVGKKEFLDSDLTFETTTTMSGGVNTRVRSNFGAQEVDSFFVGVFTIRMLNNSVTHSVDAKAYIKEIELIKNR